MPTILEHEINSYREQIRLMRLEWDSINWNEIENYTHFGLARSNRSNYMIVGLCALIEAQLFIMAQNQESQFKPSDIRGQGISRLKIYLTRVNAIDFSKLNYWDLFQSIYKIRNCIVHNYGGMVRDEVSEDLIKHFNKLKLNKYLIAKRRIRFEPEGLDKVLEIVEKLLNELHVKIKYKDII